MSVLCHVKEDENQRFTLNNAKSTGNVHNGHQKEYQRGFFLPLTIQTIANTLKGEFPRSVGAQYAKGDQWRNNSRRMKGWSQSKTNTQLWM